MDGEYVGGDGSEGEGGNVESFVMRRSCLLPATLHRRSLPTQCLESLRGQRLPANRKRPPLEPTHLLYFLGCCFLGSVPVCTAA